MQLEKALRAACAVVATLWCAGCSEVEADNPFDPEAPASVKARGAVTGTVVDGEGNPAVGAVIQLSGTSITTTAEEDGAWRLTDVPDGIYALTIEMDCHRRVSIPGIVMAIGGTIELPQIALEPAVGTIRGRIELGPGGRADVTNARVRTASGAGSARIDSDGSFVLTGVPACDAQQVVVDLPDHASATAPDVTVPQDGAAELEAPIVLTPLPGRVVGRIALPEGADGSVEGITISAPDAVPPVDTTTAADGAFVLGPILPTGLHTIVVDAPGFQTEQLRVPVPAARGDEDALDLGTLTLDFTVQPVEGFVALADGASPADITVELSGPTTAAATTTAEGRFLFPQVRGGTGYQLRATRFGYQPATHGPFDITDAGGYVVPEGALTLTARDGYICGFMVFAEADAEGVERVLPEDECPDPAEMGEGATLDDAEVRVADGASTAPLAVNGYFRLTVRPGTHTIELRRAGYQTVTRLNEFVSDDPADPKQLGEVLLPVATGRLAGRVKLVDCPQVDTQVSVVARGPRATRLLVASVPGGAREGNEGCPTWGEYQFPDLPIDDYVVELSASAYRSTAVQGAVAEDRLTDVPDTTLEFEPGSLSGVVIPEGVEIPEDVDCEALGEDDPEYGAGTEIALDGVDASATTDCTGAFVVGDIRAGNYTLRVRRGGADADTYDDLVVPTVPVLSGRETPLGNFVLPYARGRLRGVVELEDGMSPEGVQVVLDGAEPEVAIADDAGVYQFFDKRTGPYTVRALLDGYRTVEVAADIGKDAETTAPLITLPINPGRLVGWVVVPPGAEGAVSVSVVGRQSEDGSVAGAREVECTPDVDCLPGFVCEDDTCWQRPGYFAFDQLLRGSYTFRASAPDGRLRTTVQPNVVVVAGETTQLQDIELEFATGVVEVFVRLGDDDALADPAAVLRQARVNLFSNEGGVSYSAQPDDAGRATFPSVRVGTYTVVLSLPDYVPQSRQIEVAGEGSAVIVGTELEPVELAIDPGTISGIVVLEGKGPEARDGVTVQIPGTGFGAVTAADGSFTIDDAQLKAGIYSVSISKDDEGYAAETVTPVIVTAGRDTPLGTLRLAYARGGLSGTVTTADGASPLGATVSLSGPGAVDPATVDEVGAFELNGLRAGTWNITVRLPGYAAEVRENLVVATDATTVVEPIQLAIDPGRFVGRVTRPDGTPLSGARIDAGGLTTQSGADGTFTLDALKAGTYTVSVVADGYRTRALPSQLIAANADSDLGDVVLEFARGGLTGTVTTADGASPEGALVLIDGPTPGSTFVAADGVYAFGDLRVGDYTVDISFPGYTPGTRAGITVEADAVGEVPVIDLAVDPGQLVGRVTGPDGTPLAGANVDAGGRSTQSGADGTFTLGGLKAGTYTVNVVADGYRTRSLPSQSVAAGADTDLGDIVMEFARGDLRGTVVTEDVASAEGALVVLDGPTPASAFVDAEGNYVFSDLRVGTYTVDVTFGGYLPATRAGVVVEADAAADVPELTLDLNPGALTGTVAGSEGRIAGATVDAGGGRTTQTDAQGVFRIDGLKAGSYAITVSADGFRDLGLTSQAVAAGADTDLGTLRLEWSTGALEGTVTTEDDADASGAIVRVTGPQELTTLVGADGSWSFEALRVGSYNVAVTLDAYDAGAAANQVVAEDETTTVAGIQLDIDPGGFSGRAVNEAGAGLQGVTVSAGGEVTVTDAAGGFSLANLKAGTYSLTLALDGYVDTQLVNQPVEAGETTAVGAITVEYARGSIGGTVTLEDQDDGTGVTVDVDGPVRVRAVTDASGAWSVDSIRVGQYTVTATRTNYLADSQVADVNADEDTRVNLSLDLDRGCISGRIRLSDQDPAVDLTSAQVVLDQTGDVYAPSALGIFEIDDLAPGDYTITLSLDGYDIPESPLLQVMPGQTCRNLAGQPWFTINLGDLTAPDTPSLQLDARNPFTPLPGFPASPAYVRVQSQMVNGRPAYPFYVSLSTAESDPLADANFDPEGGSGFWQWRVNGEEWRPVGAAEGVNAGRTGPDRWFVVFALESRLGTTTTWEIRAIDGDGNVSDAGEIEVVLDASAPSPPSLRAPNSDCVNPQTPGGVRTCVVSSDAVNLSITLPDGAEPDPTFGCYYVYEADLAANNDTAAKLEAIERAAYDTDNCYREGTQFVTTFPEDGQSTVVCVRAFDQAGRFTSVLDADRVGAQACMIVERDDTAPEAPDLFPADVVVRGDQVALFSDTDDPTVLDPNFWRYEKRGSAPNAAFVPTDEQGPFTFTLIPGQPNRFAVRAIDRAGNVGEAVEATLYENATLPVVDDARALAEDAVYVGTRVFWTNPQFCDTETMGDRGCRSGLMYYDEGLPFSEPQQLTHDTLDTVTSCIVACPPNRAPESVRDATRRVILEASSRGILYSSYEEGAMNEKAHHLYYWGFGSDGQPGNPGNDPGDTDPPVVELASARAHNPVLAATVNEAIAVSARLIIEAPRTENDWYVDLEVWRIDRQTGELNDVLTFRSDSTPMAGNGPAGEDALDALPEELIAYQDNVLYRTTDGQLWLWTALYANGPDQEHAEIELPAAVGSVVGMAATDAAIYVVGEADDGTQAIWRIVTSGPSSRIWGMRTAGAVADNCDADQARFIDQCLPVSQVEALSCTANDDASWCGQATSFAGDDSLLAWSAQTDDDDFRLVTRRTTEGSEPALLQTQPERLDGPSVNLDRLAYLDASSGAPRVQLADSATQIWSAIDPDATHPKRYPRVGEDTTIYARYHAPLGGDWDADSGLYAMSTTGLDTRVRLPLPQAASPAPDQDDWAAGRGFDGQDDWFVYAAQDGARADRYHFAVLETRQGADPYANQLANAFSVDGINSPVVTVTNAGIVAWSGVGSDEASFRAPGQPIRVLSADEGCDAMGGSGRVIVCAGHATGVNDDRFIRIYLIDGNNLPVGPVELTEGDGLATFEPGFFTQVERTSTGRLVVELTDDEIRRLYTIDLGTNGVYNANDDIRVLYDRIGDDLGPLAVTDDSVVFADDRLTQQTEILRLRLRDGALSRLTFDDATQHHPGISPKGALLYVDERYDTTAQGAYVEPPAFTRRLPR